MGRTARRDMITEGQSDRSAGFDGSTTLLSYSSGSAFVPANNTPLTVSLWFSFDTVTAGAYYVLAGVLAATAGAGSDVWYVHRDGTTGLMTMGYSDGTHYHEVGTLSPSVNHWYFGVFAWGNTSSPILTADIWDEGGKINEWFNTLSGFINTGASSPLVVGARAGLSECLAGRIDKLGIWERTITGAEQWALYNGGMGLPGFGVEETSLATGLVDYFDFDDASGAGTWKSLLGTHPLTATGSVVSRPPAGSF